VRGKRTGWPVVVLIGSLLALGAVAIWWWLGQRRLVDDDEVEWIPEPGGPGMRSGPRRAPVAVVPIDPGPHATGTPAPDATGIPAPEPVPVAVAAAPAPTLSASPSHDEAHPFGPASAAAGADGSGPDGWTIKGNADSGLYHLPASPSWKRMHAEVGFETEEAAEAAGFKRWDWRRSAS
jgi:hypothetical protein